MSFPDKIKDAIQDKFGKPGADTEGRTGNSDMSEGGEVSEGPSGLSSAETSGGGADAVPDTPDALPDTNS